MELVLATRNPDKIREIEKILRELNISILTFKDFPDFPSIEETGKSLRENALLKARTLAKFTGKLSLADDSGLEVQFLKGAPGIYSSRFAGENASYEDNTRKLLSALKGVPYDKRDAVFRCVIALVTPEGKEMTVEGICRGKITISPKGEGGFGYDPVFQPEGLNRTFAEIPLEDKNRLSHRARALFKVKEVLWELSRIERKFMVGITGNMGCGKSTVAGFFEKWGFKVLRADDIGHKVLEREDVKKKVIAIFGDDILDSKGKILRKKLRSKVVIDKHKLFRLNTLLHPLIKKELWSELENYSDRIIFVEAALVFEAGWDFFMDRVITVYSPKDKQIERLKRNTDLSIEEINSLLEAQFSQEEKIRRADFVIPNERDLKELEINTRRVLDEILEETKGGYKG